MVDRFAPNDFRTPISRVLSVTETSIILVSAIVEPKTVSNPITHAITLKKAT